MNNDIYAPLGYNTFLEDIQKFRKSGTVNGDAFNLYDTPGHKYFRLFFYFRNDDVDGTGNNLDINSGGLLSPTWTQTDLDEDHLWQITSAWSYLKINGEEERAENLKQFVELLSNINTNSPWYFQSISGLNEAIERKVAQQESFLFENDKKCITITCIPDAYDDRIGTLLDLYRSFTWSWQNKRFILPPNLRKFDMGLYIFESPIANIHNPRGESGKLYNDKTKNTPATIDSTKSSQYLTSYKYFEFHNCEIDYNSATSGYESIKNEEGFKLEYKIKIYFDDVYETRYNEFMSWELGDMIALDALRFDYIANRTPMMSDEDLLQKPRSAAKTTTEFNRRANIYQSSGPASNIAKELIGYGKRVVKSGIKKIVLGNIFGFSLSSLQDQVKAAASGHFWNTVDAMSGYIRNNKTAKLKYSKSIGNIYKAQSVINNI